MPRRVRIRPRDLPQETLLHPSVGHGLEARFRLRRLLRRFPDRPVWAAFVLLNSFVTVLILTVVSHLARTAFVFPSLGPTAFLFFFQPTAPGSAPRHAILGHAIGLACGYASLWLFGLAWSGSAIAEGLLTLDRGLAVALSLACTGAVMVLLRVAHPPAAATTLIVSLGIVTSPFHLVLIEVAVALLTVQAIVINRLAGIDYPWWDASPRRLVRHGLAAETGRENSTRHPVHG